MELIIILEILSIALSYQVSALAKPNPEGDGTADLTVIQPLYGNSNYELKPLGYKKASVHLNRPLGYKLPRLPYPRAALRHSQKERRPACLDKDNEKTFCIDDYEYPKYEIEEALKTHYDVVSQLYKDVLLNTDNSVERLNSLEQESGFLCPSKTSYVQPQRGQNAKGKWKIIVNGIKVDYGNTLTQNVRFEECVSAGKMCPLTPEGYNTRCIQKATYQRFLVYDPYDGYSPFSIDSFKVPSSCACFAPTYNLPEEDIGQSQALSLPLAISRRRPQGMSFVNGDAGPHGRAQRLAQQLAPPFEEAELSPESITCDCPAGASCQSNCLNVGKLLYQSKKHL